MINDSRDVFKIETLELQRSFRNAASKIADEPILTKIRNAYHPDTFSYINDNFLIKGPNYTARAKFFVQEFRAVLEQAIAGQFYALNDRIGEVVYFENQVAMQKAILSFYQLSPMIIREFKNIRMENQKQVDISDFYYYFHITMEKESQYYQAYDLINIPIGEIFEPETCFLKIVRRQNISDRSHDKLRCASPCFPRG